MEFLKQNYDISYLHSANTPSLTKSYLLIWYKKNTSSNPHSYLIFMKVRKFHFVWEPDSCVKLSLLIIFSDLKVCSPDDAWCWRIIIYIITDFKALKQFHIVTYNIKVIKVESYFTMLAHKKFKLHLFCNKIRSIIIGGSTFNKALVLCKEIS